MHPPHPSHREHDAIKHLQQQHITQRVDQHQRKQHGGDGCRRWRSAGAYCCTDLVLQEQEQRRGQGRGREVAERQRMGVRESQGSRAHILTFDKNTLIKIHKAGSFKHGQQLQMPTNPPSRSSPLCCVRLCAIFKLHPPYPPTSMPYTFDSIIANRFSFMVRLERIMYITCMNRWACMQANNIGTHDTNAHTHPNAGFHVTMLTTLLNTCPAEKKFVSHIGQLQPQQTARPSATPSSPPNSMHCGVHHMFTKVPISAMEVHKGPYLACHTHQPSHKGR